MIVRLCDTPATRRPQGIPRRPQGARCAFSRAATGEERTCVPDDTTTPPRPQPEQQARHGAQSLPRAGQGAFGPGSAQAQPAQAQRPFAAPEQTPAPAQVQVRVQERPVREKSASGSFVEFVVVVAVAIALAWFITNFVVKPYEIPSESMEDTIMTGDRVLSERVSYLGASPAQGDIVTFTDVEDPTRVLIKRVVAVAGQQVELKDGSVYVDGSRLSEPYTDDKQSLPLVNTHDISYPYTVPEGCIWVMGDNRTNSSDSRYFGAVPVANVTGHAFFRYWPLERIGPLG